MAIAVPVACAVVAVAVIIVAATLMLFIYKHKKRSTVPCKLCPSKSPVLTCTPCHNNVFIHNLFCILILQLSQLRNTAMKNHFMIM